MFIYQLLTEMSTRNLLGGKGRPARKARKADNLTAIYEPFGKKILAPRLLTTYGLSVPVTEIALLFNCYLFVAK
jgi:hypothetical protein